MTRAVAPPSRAVAAKLALGLLAACTGGRSDAGEFIFPDGGSLYAPDGAGDGAGYVGPADAESTDSGRDATRTDAGGRARDWDAYPPIALVSGISELRALSDVHGDYAALTRLLLAGKLVSKVPPTPGAVAWTGGKSVFVIVGDLIDKGPDAPDVLRLVIALQASAKVAGGQVVVTMGNHEAEFLASPENAKATGSGGLDPELVAVGLGPDATAAGDDDIGKFLRDLPFAARVDDWFFVHAGNTQGASLESLAAALQSGVDAAGFGAPVLSASDSLLETKLGASPPQWWDATGNATALLAAWTEALGVSHLVMGHQPGAVGISDGPGRPSDELAAEFGGRLFLIDTGMSVGVDDTGGALLHVTDVGAAGEAWEEILPDGSVKPR